MATIDRSNELDTRGIPRRLDPGKFYQYAISRRLQDAKGVEYLLHRVIPYNLIQSLAIAFDPYSMIRLRGVRVTPANRTRSRSRSSVLDQRSYTWDWLLLLRGTHPNWEGHLGLDSPFLFDDLRIPDIAVTVLSAQPPLSDYSKDTTRRTRGPESELGEFEKQSHSLYSSSRKFYHRDFTDIRQFWPDGSNPQRKEQTVRSYHTISPSAAILTQSNYDMFRNGELSIAHSLISDHSMRMFKAISPQRRKYTLFRNVVELRDLKRSVLSLKKASEDLLALSKSIPKGYLSALHSFRTNWKDIPNEYLSYHFGWRQLYSDVKDLLVAPDHITKQINFLIRRNGKETTYRLRRRNIPVPSSVGVPGFEYYITSKDLNVEVQTEIQRKVELRLVMNGVFEFPDVMHPRFRETMFLRQLGVAPTITDLYNLTPWTWLIDWFTGLSNYVELIDNVNSDYKLINWAMVTAELDSTLVTTFNSESLSTSSYQYTPGGSSSFTERNKSHHQSECVLKSIVRKDLAGALPDVVPYTDVSRLSSFQYSILGALIAQRTKFGK